jgi:hypothetical protein
MNGTSLLFLADGWFSSVIVASLESLRGFRMLIIKSNSFLKGKTALFDGLGSKLYNDGAEIKTWPRW